MNPDWSCSDVDIYVGDSREMWKHLPENCADAIVTSPPYFGLRDYGADGQIGLEARPQEYISTMADLLTGYGERCLKRGGSLWVNLGDTFSASSGGGAQGSTSQRLGRSNVEAQNLAHIGRDCDFPAKCLLMIPERVALALIERGWILRNKVVWCLAGSTRIYARTQEGDGPHELRDLVRLDPSTVELWDGERWNRVTRWTTVKGEQGYRVTVATGEEVVVTGEHLWPTQRGNVRTDELRRGDTICTTAIPEPDEPSRPAMLDDADIGWLVGLYIAEGSRTADRRGVQIASHVNEVERHKRLERIADALDGSCRMHRTGGNAATINVYGPSVVGAIDSYVAGDSAATKRLTGRAWRRTSEFLMHVLLGYLEGDGTWEPKAERWRVGFTDNPAWASDLRAIAARLGWSLHLKRAMHRIGEKRYPGYRGDLRLNESYRQRPDGFVVSVEPARGSTFYDVTVESEPHLFALASGLLTHNCKPNGMPSSVRDRLATKWEYLFHLTRQPRYYYDLDAIRDEYSERVQERQKYAGRDIPHNQWSEESGRYDSNPGRGILGFGHRGANPAGANPGDWWVIPTQPYPGSHYAVFPPELIRRPILATVPEGGTVLDPFIGSGTTAQVARRFGRRTIGVDLNGDNIPLTVERLDGGQEVLDLGAAS